MNARMRKPALVGFIATVVAFSLAAATLAGARTGRAGRAIRFADARMIIELNATDGDAGFQIFADAEPWREFEVFRPDGRRMIHIVGENRVRDFGLTELFSESNEPPFEEMPLEEFLARFPAGTYKFRGKTVDGKTLVGAAKFSHNIPNGPVIVAPKKGEIIDRDEVTIHWRRGPQPKGVDIVRYQVILTGGSEDREISIFMDGSAREVDIPEQFLEPHAEYEGEVLAIDASGNQTITHIPTFQTR
jgi:hypothetical protein